MCVCVEGEVYNPSPSTLLSMATLFLYQLLQANLVSAFHSFGAVSPIYGEYQQGFLMLWSLKALFCRKFIFDGVIQIHMHTWSCYKYQKSSNLELRLSTGCSSARNFLSISWTFCYLYSCCCILILLNRSCTCWLVNINLLLGNATVPLNPSETTRTIKAATVPW